MTTRLARIALGFTLFGMAGLAGCGRESSTAPERPELLTHPERARPVSGVVAPPLVDDRGRAIAIAAAIAPADTVPTRVHLTTWPYKTTNLKHETKTTLYRDENGKRWLHLVTWPFDTSYIPYPDPLPTATRTGARILEDEGLPIN